MRKHTPREIELMELLEAAEKQLSEYKPLEYNPPAKTKLKELTEDKGGIHIRDAKVLRFENGSECTIDAFGKINWITDLPST